MLQSETYIILAISYRISIRRLIILILYQRLPDYGISFTSPLAQDLNSREKGASEFPSHNIYNITRNTTSIVPQ